MKVLKVENLVKRYEKFELKKVSFEVEQGTIMGFIGRNGAGKTTTLKSLLNQIHAEEGSIEFFGMNFKQNELEIKKRIGFVSGGISFYPKKTLKALTNVTRKFYDNWEEEAYRRYLEKFALDEDKRAEQLSEGMKVKYLLAVALSHRAEILILDEPTSGLDPVSRDELLDIFVDIVEREGVTILFSTHITSDLDKCADEITYISNGSIVTSQGIKEFRGSYRKINGDTEALTPELEGKLIGVRKHAGEFRAVMIASEVQLFEGIDGITVQPATLEDIMVHMEGENRV